MSHLSRRQFLVRSSASLAALGIGGLGSRFAYAAKGALPRPDKSGIKHVIVVMMENRSFDHFLGCLPGSDGRQSGLVYTDATGKAFETHPLAPDYQGCGHPDPDLGGQGLGNGRFPDLEHLRPTGRALGDDAHAFHGRMPTTSGTPTAQAGPFR